MCDYDHVTIYWLPSNGAITQCGRKAHAIKAGRTSRVQQFSLDHAVYVYNRTPMRCLEWRTPHEWFTGERPSIEHLQVLGCGAYVFIPSEVRENKMAPKAEPMVFLGMHSGGKGYIFMRGPNNIIFSAAHATFDESLFPRCPKKTLQNNTRLQEVAPPVAPCSGGNCHCPSPSMEDDDDTSHLFSRTSRKVISEAQKELDRRLQNVGVTPSQRHGMRMPPPCASAWQDRPPTPENVQHKQMQLDQPPNEPGPSKPPQWKRQPAALPPPWEKSTRKKTVPERFTDSNIYRKKHPVEIEKDILRQRDWKRDVGEESSRPRRQNIPGGVPVPDSVPYYSSDGEGGDDDESNDSEDETCKMLGSPSPSEEEEAVVSRLSREGGVSFLLFLVSKAVPVHEEKEPKEWTYKDMVGLPAGQLEEWQAACQWEIETLTKCHVFNMVVCPNGCRVIKNRWVFDVKPDGRKRARLVAKGFSQVEGKDFDQIFSPVVRFETVRLILALAALEGWFLSGLDVRNAYLYGELEECQGRPRRSPEIQSTLVWSSCWGATGGAGRSMQRGEQRRDVRTRGNKGEVGVTRDQCCVW